MSKYSTLLVPILEQILVKEIGEANIPPLEWEQSTPLKFWFEIEINGNPQYVNVEFERGGEEEKSIFLPPVHRKIKSFFNVGFDIEGNEKQFAKTDLKTLLQIISTVIDIVKYFIKTRNPDVLSFIPSEKINKKEIKQKSNLYQAFIKKGINSIPGYASDTYKTWHIIVKT